MRRMTPPCSECKHEHKSWGDDPCNVCDSEHNKFERSDNSRLEGMVTIVYVVVAMIGIGVYIAYTIWRGHVG